MLAAGITDGPGTVHRFFMIKQCHMSTHALATEKKTEKMPIISYIHSAASLKGDEFIIYLSVRESQSG